MASCDVSPSQVRTSAGKPRIFYTDNYPIPLPPGHRFPLDKYRLLREALELDGVFEFDPAPLADRSDVERVHDREYVQDFLGGTLSSAAMRRIGFPWSPQLVQRTLASVGGTLCATRDAMDRGWGGTLAGGTHHAFAGEGSGYCVFNDIAIAIRHLQTRCGLKRAAVLDLDVHQGDGTAHIFRDEPDVFTISIHCRANFPFRKQRSRLDIELDPGTEDLQYLAALESALGSLADFEPHIVYFQSGVDGLAADALGKLALSPTGMGQRDEAVMRAIRQLAVPLVITLGGGYARPTEMTVAAHAHTFRAAQRMLRRP
jgi:acetoin utilization deacetylase AcuC-like enzyme